MGSSKSSVSSAITNNTLNQNSFSDVNTNIQESATNTLVKSAKSCSSSVDQSNSCDLSNMKVTGDFVIGGTQKNVASVNFSCIQSSTAAASMSDAMTSHIGNELSNLNGTEAAAKINAAAAALSKTGSGAIGGNAKSNVSTKISNTVTNATSSAIENIFKKSLSNNFSSETVDECMGRTTQKNALNAEGTIVGGNAKVECNQSNSLEQVSECKQMAEAINKTMSEVAQELGFKMNTVNTTSAKDESKSSAATESIATGPIQDMGTALSGIIGSIGGAASLASLGAMGPFIIGCCCICCCIILSIVSSMFAMKSAGNSGNAGSAGTSNFSMQRGRKFRGGYSETESSDVIDYLGSAGIELFSDIISDSSPLFE